MKTIRLTIRFAYFIGFTLCIVAEIWLKNLFLGKDMQRSMYIRRRWARNLLRHTGVKMELYGTPPPTPGLIVANHRSYLDPILMLCHIDGYPVAKAELANWPLIGKGAKMAGIMYVKREQAGSRTQIIRQIADTITQGFPVIIFPEGTTSSLNGTLPFKKGIFKLAAQSGIAVTPVAIVFEDKRDFWVGKATFIGHARKRFMEKEIRVQLHYGAPLIDDNPEQLLQTTQAWINERLQQSTVPA